MSSYQSPGTLLPDVSGIRSQSDPDAFIIPLHSIEVVANAPRKDFDLEQMEELIHDIKQKGILEPVLVQKAPSFSEKSQKFILISGHRRLRAAIKLGMLTVPARVTPIYSEEEKLATQLCENIQRKDLHPVEIALILRFFFELGFKEKDISERISKSLSWVSKYKKICKMPKQILDDNFALHASLSELLSLESAFPRHSELLIAWGIFKSEGLKNALKGSFNDGAVTSPEAKLPDLNPTTRYEKIIGLTREFLIVTKNQNVINCKMQVSESNENDVRVIMPKQYSVDEIQEIFDKIIQSINTK